jgi:dienelactone hydrolase
MRLAPLTLALTLSSAMAQAPAPAPLPAPPASVATTYDLDLSVMGKGTEVVKLARTDDAVRLTSLVEMATPQGPMRLAQESDLAGSPLEVVRYALTLEPPGEAPRASLRATRKEAGWTLEASSAGSAREEPPKPQTKDLPVTGRSVVLDNFFPSQVDLFVRTLDLAPGGETTVTAVVPQALVAAPMKVRRMEDGRGTLDGKPVAVRRYRLNLGNVLMEAEASAEDGALLRARVPIQSVAYVRRGYGAAPEPEPAAAEDPREAAVTVSGPAVGLPGILTLPKAEGPVPAVLLLAGSGPQDRDETVGTNKPLRDLARGLADAGIASLRYDKRTYVRRDPAVAPDLAREYVEDALAALALLRGTVGIDAARIYVVGHSLGGSVAPLIVPEGKVQGLVLMAPMTRRADEVLLDQIPSQLRLLGTDEAEIGRRRGQIQAYFQALQDPKADPGPFFGAGAGYWRDWLKLDVVGLVRESPVPVLVLQGTKDIQVRADADFDRLRREAGERGGRIRYRLFPDLNHLFQRTEGPSTGAEYGIPGRVEPEVVTAIVDWIRTH